MFSESIGLGFVIAVIFGAGFVFGLIAGFILAVYGQVESERRKR